MSHILAELPYPAIIAHRGASRYAPQNTLAAFQLAVEQGADGVELDVRLSADEKLVVIHDATLEHTTDGYGNVAGKTLVELRKLNASSHFTPAWDRQSIPTLDEVFETLGKRMLINVELKPLGRHSSTLAEKVARTIERHQLQDYVICSSFSLHALQALQAQAPEIPRGILLLEGYLLSRLVALASRSLTYQTIHPYYRDALRYPQNAPPFKAQTSKERLQVFTYTVNDETNMRALFAKGIDGIFTDDPILARQVRGR